jgi:hypothetical protein
VREGENGKGVVREEGQGDPISWWREDVFHSKCKRSSAQTLKISKVRITLAAVGLGIKVAVRRREEKMLWKKCRNVIAGP